MHHITPAPSRSRRAGRGTSSLIAIIAACSITLVGCGGEDAGVTTADSGAAASSSGQGQGPDSGEMDAFRECLAENGVDMSGQPPSGAEGGQPSFDQDAMQQAQEACADLMPEGGFGGGRGGFNSEAQQEWIACLNEQGVQVESPTGGDGPPSGGFPGGDGPSGDPGDRPETPPSGERPDPASMLGLDSSDPAVAAALSACEDLQPSFGGRPQGSEPATSTTAPAA